MRDNRTTNWKVYCKTIAQGKGIEGTYARSCIKTGGRSAHDAEGRAKIALYKGKIDADAYEVQVRAIAHIEHMRKLGIHTHVVPTPADDWCEFGGGHKRINHIDNAREDM